MYFVSSVFSTNTGNLLDNSSSFSVNGILSTQYNGGSAWSTAAIGAYKPQIAHSYTDIVTQIDSPPLRIVDDPKSKIKLPSFPHSNCYIQNDSELVIEFAVAGYSKDRLSVEVSKSNQIVIKAKELEDKREYITKSISSKPFNVTLQFDETYDVQASKVDVDQGILKITIPRSEKHTITKLL